MTCILGPKRCSKWTQTHLAFHRCHYRFLSVMGSRHVSAFVSNECGRKATRVGDVRDTSFEITLFDTEIIQISASLVVFPWYPSWSPLLIGFLQRNHLCPQELAQQNLSTFEPLFFESTVFDLSTFESTCVSTLFFFNLQLWHQLFGNFGVNFNFNFKSTCLSKDFVIKLWNCWRLVFWYCDIKPAGGWRRSVPRWRSNCAAGGM